MPEKKLARLKLPGEKILKVGKCLGKLLEWKIQTKHWEIDYEIISYLSGTKFIKGSAQFLALSPVKWLLLMVRIEGDFINMIQIKSKILREKLSVNKKWHFVDL